MSEKHIRLGFLGSPNSGKTTIFNALTGLRAKVGNYPGVTVERREGKLRKSNKNITLIDLPGTYSLQPISSDEEVVSSLLTGRSEGNCVPDGLVLTVDSCAIERSLLLVVQALRLGIPLCLTITMMDELKARGGQIDPEKLSNALGIPVVGVVGTKGIGLDKLKTLIQNIEEWQVPILPPPTKTQDLNGWIASVLSRGSYEAPEKDRRSDRIDRILLHPFWGSLAFIAVMLFSFQIIFTWAEPAMNAIDSGVNLLQLKVENIVKPGLLRNFLTDGVLAGVGSVIIFLPQITLLFAVLAFLEAVGYMARAAFVVDRAMGKIGLEGRAFVALLSSYACAIPGIMAARTVPSPRQRLVTILVAPLMTCSARLPVYTLLISAFIPRDISVGPLGIQGLALFGLYLGGGVAAFLFAGLIKKFVVKGDDLPFYLELPPYRLPQLKVVARQVWDRASSFLKRAGTIILAAAIILWTLMTFPETDFPDGTPEVLAKKMAVEQSFAGRLGKTIEPVIEPLGFDWKIGIGLIASLAAREVIVATLAQVYAVGGEDESLREAMKKDKNPKTGRKVFTAATVGSMLVFFVFALQCTSTIAVMRRETNSWRWPLFAFSYLLLIAYSASFLTYRIIYAITENSL